MICASAVASPVAVTRMNIRPFKFTVPAYNLSPAALSTGSDSPVSMDSSTVESPYATTPSTGTWSPGFKITTSSTRNSPTGTSVSLSSGLRRRAVAGASCINFFSEPSAFTMVRASNQCPRLISVMIAADSMK